MMIEHKGWCKHYKGNCTCEATNKDQAVTKLAFIRKKDNPLASVETDLKKVLDDFERRYFQITHPEQQPRESKS